MYRRFIQTIANTLKQALIGLIKTYQYIASPWIGQHCRFHPSCSQYAREALERFGVIKGCYLTIKRLLRCQPFAKGGEDPVPDRQANQMPNNPVD